jgi:uncharacterized membrane protein YvbJ
MLCGNCGWTNSATAKFCNQCGRAFTGGDQPAAARRCRNCGAEVRAGRKFCRVCGQPVGSLPPAAPPADASLASPEADDANQSISH